MSASIGNAGAAGLPDCAAMLPAPRAEDFGGGRFDPLRRRPAVRNWRQRWERPLTWWSVIFLCSGFWYGILHLAGAV